MTKPLRVVAAVAEHDLPAIVAYHLPRSRAKAERIVAEYDRMVPDWILSQTLMRDAAE